MNQFIPISFNISACNCPRCGAFAQFQWYQVYIHRGGFNQLKPYALGWCQHCNSYTVWVDQQMVDPVSGNVPSANIDLPQDVIEDYNEAASILTMSPRGATALLRLAIQKLCKSLGGTGENINGDIKTLVANGLPPIMQKALDSVRVVGNNAVHPGQIDLKDDAVTALKLFGFVNIIADTLITQPKQIAEFYTDVLPEKDKAAIQKRDNPN